MKNVAKILGWAIAMMAVMGAIMYGFWLLILFWIFEEAVFLWLTMAGMIGLFVVYWLLVRIAAR